MNFFQVLSLPLKRKLAQMAISQARTSLLKALPGRHPTTGRAFAWSNYTPSALLDGVVRHGTLDQSKVGRIILESWYKQQKRLCKQVTDALRAANYAVAITPSTKPVASPRVEPLREEDIIERDNKPFFYPAGQPMSGEASDEEITLMAALLGWSAYTLSDNPAPDANPVDEETDETAMEDNEPEAAPSTTEWPTTTALENSQPSAVAAAELMEDHVVIAADAVPSIEALEAAATQLAEQLSQLAQQLLAGELPEDFQLIAVDLAALRQRYQLLAAEWQPLTAPLLAIGTLPPPPIRPSIGYLRVMQEMWLAGQQVAQQTAVRQHAALDLLIQVARIRYLAAPEFRPLAEVQATASVLAANIAAVEPPAEHHETAELVAGTHPLALLLQLAADSEAAQAVDEEGEVAHILEAALPPKLVLALLRGRLAIGDEVVVAAAPVPTASTPVPPVATMLPAEPAALEASEPAEALEKEAIIAENPVVDLTVVDETALVETATTLPEPAPIQAPPAALKLKQVSDKVLAKSVLVDMEALPVPVLVTSPTLDPELKPDLVEDASEWDWLADAQWELLEQRRYALAWQLTAAAPVPARYDSRLLAAWELQCLVLAQEIGPATTLLQSAYTAALEDGRQQQSTDSWPRQAVRVAAAWRPALLAPFSQAAGLLQSGLPGMPCLNELSQLVALRDSPEPLQPALLKQYQSEQQLQQDAAHLRTELRQWRATSQHAEFRHHKNHPMTAFWRYNWQPDQPIGQLVSALEKDRAEAGSVALVRVALAQLQDDAQLARNLREASLELTPNRQVWQWFKLHLSPLLSMAQRWLAQQQQTQAGRLHYRESQDQQFCRQLSQLLPPAAAEVAALRRRETSASMLGALDQLAHALSQLDGLLQGHTRAAAVEPTLDQILTIPLLRTVALPLVPPASLAVPAADLLLTLRQAVAAPELAWPEAYQLQLKAGNFLACALLRAWPPALYELGGSAELPRAAYQAELRQQEPRLRHALKQAGPALEAGVRKGYVGEQLRMEGSILLDGLNEQLTHKPRPDEAPLSFPYLYQQLDGLLQALEASRQQSVRQVAEELNQLLASVPDFRRPATEERIARVLQESAVSIAHHYVAQLRVNEDITSVASETSELHTFLGRLPALESSASATPDVPISSLQRGGRMGGQELKSADLKTRELAAQAVADWEELRATRELNAAANYLAIGRLLVFVGMRQPTLAAVATTMPAGYEVIDLDNMLVQGKDQCPIALFASEAKGAYRLLLARTRVSEVDELFNQVEAASEPGLSRRAMLVFYFHPLTLSQRHDLAGLSREKKRTFLVLDTLLLLYLASAGLQRARLPLFFQLTIPYTYVKPYITGGSTLPPEMFYGREAEKRQLLSSSSDSSCLVYGGRQLGKTAILRDIQRMYHQPAQNQLVLFLDIRQLGFEGHPIEGIVRELAKLLQPFEAFGQLARANSSGKMKISRLLDHVRQWLNENATHRLLLFLDEADQFLNQDAARQFEYTTAFKNLMDDTERRFKVVFSGTHNVQRTYRLANQPLSQLGTAVCIGPLIARNEVREAEALVRRPLESLGFEFEKDELVTEILVETNYFPSLIQVFCDRLLTHLYTTYTSEPGQQPHYRINEYDISTTLHKARADIRGKFLLTLDLNNRFKLLAYLLASPDVEELFGDPAQSGLTASQLHEAARYYWPMAFGPHSSDADFQVLLDEVIELSVASYVVTTGTYHLRTPNLRQLLGTPADVERELQTFARLPVPDAYQADLARDVYGGPEEAKRLPGPFTAAQYGIIRTNGTTVVRGTEAAGLLHIERFLKSQPDVHCKVLGQGHDPALRQRELTAIKDERPPNKTTVVLVCERYGLELVRFAAELTRELTSETRPLHIVFLMDPPKLLKELSEHRAELERLRDLRVSLVELLPWQPRTLSQWLKEEAEVPTYTERVQQLTGGWYDPLYYFLNFLAQHPDQTPAAALAALENYVREQLPATKWGIRSGAPEEEVLRLLASINEPLTQAEVEDWLPALPAKAVALALAWAEVAGLVVAGTERGTVRAQEYVSRILS